MHHQRNASKTKLRHHYTPIRMIKLQNTINIKDEQGCEVTAIVCRFVLVGMQKVQTLWQFLVYLIAMFEYDLIPKLMQMLKFQSLMLIVLKSWKLNPIMAFVGEDIGR